MTPEESILELLIGALTDSSVPEQGKPRWSVRYDGDGTAEVTLTYRLVQFQADQLGQLMWSQFQTVNEGQTP